MVATQLQTSAAIDDRLTSALVPHTDTLVWILQTNTKSKLDESSDWHKVLVISAKRYAGAFLGQAIGRAAGRAGTIGTLHTNILDPHTPKYIKRKSEKRVCHVSYKKK